MGTNHLINPQCSSICRDRPRASALLQTFPIRVREYPRISKGTRGGPPHTVGFPLCADADCLGLRGAPLWVLGSVWRRKPVHSLSGDPPRRLHIYLRRPPKWPVLRRQSPRAALVLGPVGAWPLRFTLRPLRFSSWPLHLRQNHGEFN